jgi:acyl carrier protein
MPAPIKKIDQDLLRSMSDEDIASEIVVILRRVVPHELNNVQLDSKLVDDIGIDSLGSYELIMDAEDRFGIEIDDGKLASLSTIRDIVTFVKTQVE